MDNEARSFEIATGTTKEIPETGNPSSPKNIETFTSLLTDIPSSEGNSSAFLDQLVEQIAKEMMADLVLLFGWNELLQQWFYFSSVGLINDFREKGFLPRAWQSLPTIVFQKGADLFSEDISKDRAFIGQMIRGTPVSTFFGTTLFHEGIRVGSLCIGYNKSNALAEDHRDFFLFLSKKIVSALIERGIKPTEAPAPGEITCPVAPVKEETVSVPVVPTMESPVVESPALPVREELEVPIPVIDIKAPVQEMKKREPPPLSIKGKEPPPKYQEAAETDQTGAKRPSERREREGVEGATRAPEIDLKIKLLESFFPALSSVFLGEDFSKEILRKIVALLGCDSGYLLKFEEQSQRLFPVAYEGITGEIVKRIDKSGVKPDPMLGKALDRRFPILVPFQDWKSSLKKRLCGEAPFQSAIMTSIRSENGTWGILSLFHRTQTFSQKELKLLEFVGEKIGFLLDTMSNWNLLSNKVETMALAQSLGRSIIKGGSVVIPSLLNGVTSILRASNCYLLLLDEQKNLLYGVASSNHAPEGITDVEIRMDENGVVPLTVKQNHFMVVENALSDIRIGKKWADHFRSRSLLSIPLVARERVIGVLIIDETAYFRSFTEAEIETVVGLAPSAAIAIDMAIKYQEALQRQERQDHLSLAILQTHEQERRQTALAFGNGTGVLLEQVSKQIKEAGKTLPLEQIESKKQLEDACLKLEKAVSELEKLSTDLYPYQLEEQGFIPALRGATEAFSKSTGVSVQLNAPSAIKSISPWLEIHLYRVVSEALQNVSKHSHAKSVAISVEKKDIYLHLSITDQGRGFDTRRYFCLPQGKRKGIGILGMKGRIELLGGTFFIESEQEHGTRVSIKVPLMRGGSRP
ncbi:MAG: GAF domain-containing protein [Nitrospirae bacterium]|nr:GAF domain-containing protein [Candidatus Troglogloeales bacterium]